MNRPNFSLCLPLVLALFFLIPSCSDSPTDAPATDPSQATGRIDPAGGSEFLLGAVTTGSNASRLEVWAQNLKIESDEMVSFDAVIVNKSRWPVHAPIHFVITRIRPDIVEVTNADMTSADGPVFDFSDDLGEDDVLGAGEASQPVNMKFHSPGLVSFAIGFRIDVGSSPGSGVISGIVFNDLNGNGEFDPNVEPGIADFPVEMVPSQREVVYRTRTDERGRYLFPELTADVYRVTAIGGPGMEPTTPNPLIVTLVQRPDGTVSSFDGANFGFWVEPTPLPIPLFGPVPVGPASPNGTELDSTFVVPDFFVPVDLYLTVVPPPILGPFPLDIDEASVAINGITVWDFECVPPDSVCMPAARVLLDPSATMRENTIRMRAVGDPRSLLLFAIEAQTVLDRKEAD
ncbi:MAG: hypothetical protein OEN01_04355 [Candidatus Krumholzibacteria bacterium]|nr:hypothetical protein [Candidatus Krumholzibacteria bacterium]